MLCLFQIDFEYLSPCLIKHFAVVHKFLHVLYKSQALINVHIIVNVIISIEIIIIKKSKKRGTFIMKIFVECVYVELLVYNL